MRQRFTDEAVADQLNGKFESYSQLNNRTLYAAIKHGLVHETNGEKHSNIDFTIGAQLSVIEQNQGRKAGAL